jgi:molybdopterin converting factor small subunit
VIVSTSRRSPPFPPGRLKTEPGAPAAVRVLLFAAAREAAGGRSSLTVHPGKGGPLALGELLDRVVQECPALRPVLRHSRIAVNGGYVAREARDLPLGPHDEVAILPPYSGG